MGNSTQAPWISDRGVRDWREALNSDALLYGGSGQGNSGWVGAVPLPLHGRPYSLCLTLPPLGVLVLRRGPRTNPDPV